MSQEKENMPRWYVVHTYSGYENKVKTDLEKTIKNRELEEFFFDIIVPMEEQIEIKDGQRKTNLKKVFKVSNEYRKHDYVFEYRKDNDGEIIIALCKEEEPLRDYFFYF